MFDAPKPTLALALTAVLMFSGCIGNGQDDALGFLSDDSETTGAENVAVELSATNGSADLAHIGFELDSVFAHDANETLPDGYHEISLASERADVLTGDETQTVTVATGELPAGTYDQVLFRLVSAQAHGAEAMEGHGDHGDHAEADANSSDDHAHGADAEGHAHGDSDDGHDDASASGKSKLSVTTGSVDLPVNVTFDILADETTTLELVLDAGASTTADSFQPTFEKVVVKRGGEEVDTVEDVGVDTSYAAEGPAPETPRPAARLAVFAPNGDQAYEPTFDPEQGVFVNSLPSAYGVNETLRFSGTESEAVATGATIESYTWDLDDATTAEGPTIEHAYTEPGVYEVELTVTDSNQVSGTHTVRVVVASWTSSLVDASFEDDAGDWTTTTNSLSNGTEAGALTEWAITSGGLDESQAYHVGNHGEAGTALPYEPFVTANLTSPEVQIPSDWLQAGFNVHVRGSSESGLVCIPSELTVSYTANGTTTQVNTFTGSQGDWAVLGSEAALDELRGKTVQFTFSFSTFCNPPSGEGWYVDDFTIGGISPDQFANAHLLEEGGDGHGDHGHSH